MSAVRVSTVAFTPPTCHRGVREAAAEDRDRVGAGHRTRRRQHLRDCRPATHVGVRTRLPDQLGVRVRDGEPTSVGACAGIRATMRVAVTEMIVACRVSTDTLTPALKFDPLMVTSVLPLVGPLAWRQRGHDRRRRTVREGLGQLYAVAVGVQHRQRDDALGLRWRANDEAGRVSRSSPCPTARPGGR